MTSKQLAERVAHLSLEKKATDVLILDLRPLSSMTDYFVICTGETNTQVKAISEHISEKLKKDRIRPLHIEGLLSQEWVLLDYVSVVVHVFQPHKREFYNLERLWGDAETVEVRDD
ncbi:MAG: ribosome silencing factor [Calditrichaeota bacterium]|nr:MAG: ribosome silencing factor [Calditrichota bacterium]